MFTGLIAAIGTIRSARSVGGGLRVQIAHDLGGEPVVAGESIAVDGCCLTALSPLSASFDAELSPETLLRTGGRSRWRAPHAVNLERAVRVGDRLGGHLVQGHADGLARLLAVRRHEGGWVTLRVDLPVNGRRWVLEKGSIALDGVSLTIAKLGASWFEVALIPQTLAATTLAQRRAGEPLIVEYDLFAKYATRSIAALAW